jgi:hypothetical protein
MIAPGLELANLRQELENARSEYELCQFIDYYPDVVRCRDRWRRQIEFVEAKIVRLEESRQ